MEVCMTNKDLALKNDSHPWFTFHDQFSDLMKRFNEDLSSFQSSAGVSHFIPKVEVQDLKDQYLVKAEIPGMEEKDINIDIVDNVLTLEGERKSDSSDEGNGYWRSEISYGKFYRTIPLREDVDEEKCDAEYKDGVLKITLGKKADSKRRSKKIAVNRNKSTELPKH